MKTKLLIMILCQTAFIFSGKAFAAAANEDTDMGVEESITDSEAHNEAAKQAKDRMEKEKTEALVAREHAKIASEEAKAKRKQAVKSIAKDEAQYEKYKVENALLKRQIKKLDAELVEIEHSISKSHDKVDGAKEKMEGLQNEKSDHQAKISALEQTREEVLKDLAASRKSVAQAQAELSEVQGKEAVAQQNLQTSKADSRREKIKNEAKIAHLKAHYEEAVEHTKSLEHEAELDHQRAMKLEAQVKDQEEVVNDADKRLKEATAKWRDADKELASARSQLAQAKEAAAVKAAAIKSRASASNERARVADAETQSIHQKIQSQQQASNSKPEQTWAPVPEPSPAPRVAGNGMTLKRDCKIHDQPNKQSATLGIKLGGQSVPMSHAAKTGNWVNIKMDDGHTGFIAASCF